jgi:hypothetical protein
MDVTDFDKRLGAIRALLYELIEDVDEVGISGGKEEIAFAAAAFQGLLDYVKEAKGYIDTEAITRIEYTPVPIETSEGTVEVLGGTKRKAWDHERLGSVVAKRIVESSIDPDTGEVLRDSEQMINEMLKYVGVSYWRVGALKDLGLNADNYCEATEGPKKVKITKLKGV